MKKLFFLAAFLTAAASSAQPAAKSAPWTLQDCISYALEHNLSVQQSALQVEQREIELNTARSNRLPAVSAGASQNFSFGRGLTEDNTYAHTNTTNTSFSLGADMPLFNGLRIQNNIALSKLNLQAATEDLEKARDDIRVAVAQAYVQILYNREILEVAQRQVEIDSLQVERLEARLANGKAAPADVALQKASLAQSRLTVVQASNNLQFARLELTQLLELHSPEGFDVAAPAIDRQHRLLPPSPESVFEEAVGIKPSVKAAETRLAYAERNISLAKGGYLPTLSLSGGLGTNYYTSSGYSGRGFFDQLSNNFSQYVGLSLSVPIFSRFTIRNGVRTAKLQYNSQEIQLQRAKNTLYKEIQQAWNAAVAARAKHESTQKAGAAAEDAFELTKAKYENGKATVTEFNESLTRLVKAQSDALQATYECLYQTSLLEFYRGGRLEL